MIIRILGSIMIICACSGAGLSIANDFKREEQQLQMLIHALDYMGNELQMRLTPLPQLFHLVQKRCTGALEQVFAEIARRLDQQAEHSASGCVKDALIAAPRITPHTRNALKLLGLSLGRFDLPGQLQGLESVKQYCSKTLETMSHNRDNRLRSYQTLGLCCGIAIAILFI